MYMVLGAFKSLSVMHAYIYEAVRHASRYHA